jgi:hypothetical protein
MADRIDYGKIAQAVYGDKQNASVLDRTSWKQIQINGKDYFTCDSGFQGAAYGKDTNNDGKYDEIVISYAGTDPTSIKDIHNDLDIALGKLPDQYEDALTFYNMVLNSNTDCTNFSITGHSLGGALAQLIGAKTGKNTMTFNAPGVYDILSDPKIGLDSCKNYTNIQNYSIINDPIGNFGVHVGSSYIIDKLKLFYSNPIDPHTDYKSLREDTASLNENITFEASLNLDLMLSACGAFSSSLLSHFFFLAKSARTPLVLDLDGDGIETTAVNSGTNFDHNSNGFAEDTGWVKGDDGLLVLDRNSNGVIETEQNYSGTIPLCLTGRRQREGFRLLLTLILMRTGKSTAVTLSLPI